MTARKEHPHRNFRSQKIGTLDDIQLSYLAGLFDGEGCVGVYETTLKTRDGRPRPAFHFCAEITNTYWPIIQWLLDNVGGRYFDKQISKAHWSKSYAWKLTGANAQYFFEKIRPYCIIKSDQIDAALKFRKTFNQPRGVWQTPDVISEKREMVAKIKELKRAKPEPIAA